MTLEMNFVIQKKQWNILKARDPRISFNVLMEATIPGGYINVGDERWRPTSTLRYFVFLFFPPKSVTNFESPALVLPPDDTPVEP